MLSQIFIIPNNQIQLKVLSFNAKYKIVVYKITNHSNCLHKNVTLYVHYISKSIFHFIQQ